jgi:hypothetical protein
MNRSLIAMILAFFGTVFMLAMAFDILAQNLALFLGIICYSASGLVWRLPIGRANERDQE